MKDVVIHKEGHSQGRQQLKKHAFAVHCNAQLNLVQRKVTNALLYNAYNELLTKETHEIEIRRLANIIGFHSNDLAQIKKALKTLLSTVIEWNILQESVGEVWNASTLLSGVSISGAVCSYSYSPQLRELLYHPSRYVKLPMSVIMKFKSSYGLALYENCMRYIDLGKTKTFELSVFRKLMGVADDKYSLFRDFKRRVLDPAVNEVNTRSNIRITDVNLIRRGRAVQAVSFIVKKRAPTKNLGKSFDSRDQKFSNETMETLVRTMGLNPSDADRLIADYTANELKTAIDGVYKSRQFKNKEIKNLYSYIKKVLDSKSDIQEQGTCRKNTLSYFEKQQLQEEYEDYVVGAARKIFEDLPREEQENKINIYLSYIKDNPRNGALAAILNKEYLLSNKGEMKEFLRFLSGNKPDFGSGVMLEEFKELSSS